MGGRGVGRYHRQQSTPLGLVARCLYTALPLYADVQLHIPMTHRNDVTRYFSVSWYVDENSGGDNATVTQLTLLDCGVTGRSGPTAAACEDYYSPKMKEVYVTNSPHPLRFLLTREH